MECKLRKQHRYLILVLNTPHKYNYIWSATELAIKNKYTLKGKCSFLGPLLLQLRSKVFGKGEYLNGGRFKTNEKKLYLAKQDINLGHFSLSKLNSDEDQLAQGELYKSRMMMVSQGLRGL